MAGLFEPLRLTGSANHLSAASTIAGGGALDVLLPGVVVVRNVTNSSDHRCDRCSDWLQHWERAKRRKATVCGACGAPATDGGHVVKRFGPDRSWWIIPLCRRCNHRRDDFTVYETDLAPASVTLGCFA